MQAQVGIMVDDRRELPSPKRLFPSKTHQNFEVQPEVEESESLAAASEHRICIDQTISNIVTENKVLALEAYGGSGAVSKALKTALDKGLAQKEAIYYNENLASWHNLAATRKFFYLVLEASMNKTILLLFLIATLSLGLGIMEEGLDNGWVDGVVILIAIAVIILFTCIHKYMQEPREHKKTEKKPSKDAKPPYFNLGCLRMLSKSTYSINRLNLEAQLDQLYNRIHIVGLIICILTLILVFLRYPERKMDEDNDYRPESMEEPTATRTFANTFKKIITESKCRALIRLLSVSMVGLTEGVPLVISLAIRNCNHFGLSGRAAIQDSLGVANMALVTRICTDTFSGFSEDEMEIGKIVMGGEEISGCTTLPSNVVETLRDGFGTSKEKVFLHWAKDKFGFKREQMMRRWEILETRGTNQFEEPCGVLMMRTHNSDTVWHLNGPLVKILSMCRHYYDSNGHKTPIDNIVRRSLEQSNEDMLHTHLRTVAFAYKHVDTIAVDENDFVLVALLGLKKKNKVAMKAQVNEFRKCGIETVVVSSKKAAILQDYAVQCGVITNEDSKALVITGEVFRKFTSKERHEKVKNIRVLAEATPSDKLLLVKTLREKDEVVAFLGQRTDEALALKEADIGIAMGTSSATKARESCDIFIQDGSFSDLIIMAESGRYIYHNIQSFLQLVLIMTTSSTLINLLGTAVFGEAPLSTFELVWVNLIVEIIGGYALLTNPKQLARPDPRKFLITSHMTKNILSQVLYAAVYVVILQALSKKSIISYSFILCQIFNLFNSRELERKNFFKGIILHKQFWVAAPIFLVLQISLVKVQEILGYGARMNLKLWTSCFLIGLGSWMVDWLGKVFHSDH